MKGNIFKYTGIALTSFLIAGAISCRKAPTNTSTSGIATIVCDASFENIMDQEIVCLSTIPGKGKHNPLL